MVIKPLIRSNMCINAHPIGCAKEVENQIAYVEKKASERGKLPCAPKNVLVLGCSTGYGLAANEILKCCDAFDLFVSGHRVNSGPLFLLPKLEDFIGNLIVSFLVVGFFE